MSQQQSTPDQPRFRRSPVSFVLRGGRLTIAQQRAWDTRRDTYLVDVPAHHAYLSVDPKWRFDAATEFGRIAPLVLEIGSGQGDAIVNAAAGDPDRDYVAVEVYQPGAAQVMVRADMTVRSQERAAAPGDRGMSNLRVMQVNAAELLTTAIPAGMLEELWTFFPDPWHKKRHHKRRLVTPEFAQHVARALRPGGVWRLATDWADYAEQMFDVLEANPILRNQHAPRAVSPRFEGRVVTNFERKAHKAGRDIADLTYVRL